MYKGQSLPPALPTMEMRRFLAAQAAERRLAQACLQAALSAASTASELLAIEDSDDEEVGEEEGAESEDEEDFIQTWRWRALLVWHLRCLAIMLLGLLLQPLRNMPLQQAMVALQAHHARG